MEAVCRGDKNVQVRSTWPDGCPGPNCPGDDCLPYDGSEVPDCSEYIDPDHYVPYYHEHSQSKNPSPVETPRTIPPLSTTQIAADSGSVVQLTRLVSLSAPHALACSSLVGSMIRNATTSVRVNKDSNGQPPSTKSKPPMPSVRILKTSPSGSTSGR